MVSEKLISKIVQSWKSKGSILRIVSLTPDASSRRYFRAFLRDENGKESTAIVMYFQSTAPAEAEGGGVVPSDRAYLDLTEFFQKFAIPVPELYWDAREQSALIVEDLGDVQLAHLLSPISEPSSREIVTGLYRDALEWIFKIQQIAPQPQFFPFRRKFTAAMYLREMSEFTEYFLSDTVFPDNALFSAAEKEALGEAFLSLAQELETFPIALSHRDYHSWNLLVDSKQRLRIIDFQDALLAPRSYDLVGLLNDRDTDSALGPELYRELFQEFMRRGAFGSKFIDEYDRVLLQRDLKVVGRFVKLATLRGLEQYKRWIPGTLRRIGRTLRRICEKGSALEPFQSLLTKLCRKVPEVQAGRDGPLWLRD